MRNFSTICFSKFHLKYSILKSLFPLIRFELKICFGSSKSLTVIFFFTASYSNKNKLWFVVSTKVTSFIDCNLDGHYKILVPHINASYSSVSLRSNLLIIPSTEHPMKHVGVNGSNCKEVISPLKLSLNYELCFIFLKSQNTNFDAYAAHIICSLRSRQLNDAPGSKISEKKYLKKFVLVWRIFCPKVLR